MQGFSGKEKYRREISGWSRGKEDGSHQGQETTSETTFWLSQVQGDGPRHSAMTGQLASQRHYFASCQKSIYHIPWGDVWHSDSHRSPCASLEVFPDPSLSWGTVIGTHQRLLCGQWPESENL